ncbi:MAG TPA: hypothetical protein VFX16_24270 [Pseudonocardiaceae bacterium]|nr:hypothetical protein [Pseudonocardiaceae bacterium]
MGAFQPVELDIAGNGRAGAGTPALRPYYKSVPDDGIFGRAHNGELIDEIALIAPAPSPHRRNAS